MIRINLLPHREQKGNPTSGSSFRCPSASASSASRWSRWAG